MTSKWIIYGLLAIALIIVLNLAGPFKGSVNSDFPDDHQPLDSNPISTCPDSPNCVRLSIKMEPDSERLFEASMDALREMGAEDLDSNSDSLKIDAVFKIPVFGFRDDFHVQVTEGPSDGVTFLHVSSRSRTGKGDLGVNRRRVKLFLKSVQSNL